MLHTKHLSELLTSNVHPELYPRLFAISSNGALVAYSIPAPIKGIRNQAALISMALRDQTDSDNDQNTQHIETLTVHLESQNVIARRISSNLYLVLLGRLPPHVRQGYRVLVEREGDDVRERDDQLALADRPQQDPKTGDDSDDDDESMDDVLSELLRLQRDKVDAIAAFISSELAGLEGLEDGT